MWPSGLPDPMDDSVRIFDRLRPVRRLQALPGLFHGLSPTRRVHPEHPAHEPDLRGDDVQIRSAPLQLEDLERSFERPVAVTLDEGDEGLQPEWDRARPRLVAR